MTECHTSGVAQRRRACRPSKRVRNALGQSTLPAQGLDETVLNIIGRLDKQSIVLDTACRGAVDAAHQERVTPRAPGHCSGDTEEQRMPEGRSA